MTERDPAIWFILDNIQEDISKINEKWESSLVTTTRLTENMGSLTQSMHEIKGLMSDIKSEISIVQKHLGVRSKKELAIERWKTLGKIAAIGTLVLPGIISFLHGCS